MSDTDKNKIRENLEEQFGKIQPEEKLPKDLKEEVFNTLDTFSLFADIVDLFTVKFTQSETELLDLMNSDPEIPRSEEEAQSDSSD